MYLHCTHGEEECKYTVRAIRQAVRSRDQHWTIREGIPLRRFWRWYGFSTTPDEDNYNPNWHEGGLKLTLSSKILHISEFLEKKCWKRKKEKQNDSEISGSFLFCNVKYLITQKMLLKNYFSLNMSIYHRKR